jgi:hypothetical protein
MGTGRSEFTATLLDNGLVLVADGGYSNPQAELYDPASAKFTATGHMVAGIGVETATLLADGRVLLVGVGINTPLADLYWP